MPDYKRRLTAIFSADVAGYSRLMGDDEALTVKTLTEYRDIMYSLIKQHRGRVVDSPGDNLLAEFPSVVDAAQCGVAIQKELKARNSELHENRRMEFRIGINLGDIIEEDERIYGDGVNIAARLESLADPGGICISKTAFDHIESKLPLGYEFIGEQTVKNISKPVFAYKVIMDPRVVTASIFNRVKNKSFWSKRNFFITAGIVVLILILSSVFGIIPRCSDPQTEKVNDQRPSIIVLPFKNISGDTSQNPFSDGITEELIHSLAKIKGLKVISSTSSFYYKDQDVPISKIGEELSVNYALEGSVRKDETEFLIYAQLINVSDDNHMLSLKYKREQKDIFSVQEEISKAVASELKIKLHGTEYENEKETSIIEHERRIGFNVLVDDGEIIRGGLLAAGLNINIEGAVKGGLEAYGGHIVISGTSQDRVDFRAGDVTLSGNFKDNVKGNTGSLIVSGTFEKDLEVDAQHITLTSSAVIKGDFKYSGILERKDGSQVAGKITAVKKTNTASFPFVVNVNTQEKEKSFIDALLSKVLTFFIVLILGLFMYYLIPGQNEKIIATMSSNPVMKSVWKGIVIHSAALLIMLISFISVIGKYFGLVFTLIFLVVFLIGIIYSTVWAGRKLLLFFKLPFSDNFIISLIAGFIVIEAISIIPYAGWFVKIFLMLIAVSAIWQTMWSAVQTDREEARQKRVDNVSGKPPESPNEACL